MNIKPKITIGGEEYFVHLRVTGADQARQHLGQEQRVVSEIQRLAFSIFSTIAAQNREADLTKYTVKYMQTRARDSFVLEDGERENPIHDREMQKSIQKISTLFARKHALFLPLNPLNRKEKEKEE